jgi:FkbM family methyltransferase
LSSRRIPASAAERAGEAARQQAARRVARVVSVLALFGRNRAVELLMRAMFGDVVEADGQLYHVDPRDRVSGCAAAAISTRPRRGSTSGCCARAWWRWTWRQHRVLHAAVRAIGGPDGPGDRVRARRGQHGHAAAAAPENGYANITPEMCAVADTVGEISLRQAPENFGDHRVRRTAMDRPSVTVPLVTLDSYFAPGSRVDFVKMDIQGAEQAALTGARRVLEENPGIVIAAEYWAEGIREYGGDPAAMLHDLAAMGFRLSLIGEPGTHPAPIEGAAGIEKLAASPKTYDLLFHRGDLQLTEPA